MADTTINKSSIPSLREVEVVSRFTGRLNVMKLNVSDDQIEEFVTGQQPDGSRRRNIQEIFPQLTATEREFLQTGSTPEEWDAVFGGDE